MSIRAFSDDAKPSRIQGVPLAAGLDYLINVAEDIARRAANDPKKIVFTPPLGVFNNEEKAREKDLIAGLVLSVDCDQHPDEARETLEGILGPATVAVRSGGKWTDEAGQAHDKLHLHWRLSKPARDGALPELKRARELAARIVGGDMSNVPIVHPIRWPGSWHRKADPVLCTIAAEDSDAEIDLAAALRVLEAAVSAQPQGNGADPDAQYQQQTDDGERADWAELTANIIGGDLHLSTVRMAASHAALGMDAGHSRRMLRALVLASNAPHDEKWQARIADLDRIVRGAQEKFAPKTPPAAPRRSVGGLRAARAPHRLVAEGD